ncbi:AraC family transcriptional regulator [Reyranella sp.]|uniref:AraC family transcriptional regulator n=1 Tax=Reyranella sp. TaxID=1929291 RepID=UPI003D0C9758
MIETPNSPADPPDLDVLSEMLRAVRLTGAVFFSGRLTAPFALLSPKRYDGQAPMAQYRHVSIFHFITAGDCTIETASGQRRVLGAGDVVLLPFADAHRFWKGDAEMALTPDLIFSGPADGIWRLDHGGGGPETRFVCGFIESSEFLMAPLFRTLPELLVEQTAGQTVSRLIAATVREAMALVDAATPGAQMTLGRMMETLFVEMLRRHAETLAPGSTGWFAALKDPIVGRALQLVHAAPGRHWTTGSLARAAGTSRTVLADRFNALLGRPPIDYVTGWRIQLAADRLRDGRDSIASIAEAAGYDSDAAFGRAFKRVTGITPGRWRAGDGDSRPHMPIRFQEPLV